MSAAPGERARTARILIADDERTVREFLLRAMQHAGYDAVAVPDGLAALDALHKDSFDLLLSDIVMPGLDGIALALKVSKERPDLPILLITGYAAEKQRAYGLESLIHTVISKPFSLNEIIMAVSQALGEDDL